MPTTGRTEQIRKARILVVDPDPSARARIAEIVRSAAEVQVDCAATAAQALEALDAAPAAAAEIVLVLARFALPDGSGLDLWHAVRDRAGRRGDAGCVLIGDDGGAPLGEDAVASAIATGADVAQPPLRAAELGARVRRALADQAARTASAARARRLTERYRITAIADQ